MKKTFRNVALVVAVALLVSGAQLWASGGGEQTPAGGAVTIVWGTDSKSGPPGFEMRENLIIKPFEQRNPNIKIMLQQFVGQDWQDKVTAQIAAGSAPDVICSYGTALRRWIEAGQALSLDGYVDEELKDTNPRAQALFGTGPGGHTYTLPHHMEWYTLYYNKELFDAAGVAYPDETWDWNTLLTSSQKLTRKEPGKPGVYGYQVVGALEWNLSNFIYQNGGHVIPGDQEPGTDILLDEPAAMEAMQFVYDLQWKYKVSPTTAEMGDQQPWDTFLYGKVAMQTNGMSDFKFNLDGANFTWDIAQMPRGPVKRATNLGADGIMVYAKTKYPEQAVLFLKHLVSPEAVEVRMREEGLMTARISEAAKYRELSPFSGQLDLDAFLKDFTNGVPTGTFWLEAAKVRELLDPVLEKIYTLNTATVQKDIPEIVAKIRQTVLSK